MLRAAAGSKPRRCGWPSLVARFKVIFDEADRIQSELGIRFCRPQVRCLPPTFQLNRARYYSIIHAPRTPGSGKAKGGGGRPGWLAGDITSRPSPALEKQDRIRARASSPSKVASPPGGRGSDIPRQHHAAAIHQERHAVGSSPFQLRTCLSSSTCSTFQQRRREQRRRKLIVQALFQK